MTIEQKFARITELIKELESCNFMRVIQIYAELKELQNTRPVDLIMKDN